MLPCVEENDEEQELDADSTTKKDEWDKPSFEVSWEHVNEDVYAVIMKKVDGSAMKKVRLVDDGEGLVGIR